MVMIMKKTVSIGGITTPSDPISFILMLPVLLAQSLIHVIMSPNEQILPGNTYMNPPPANISQPVVDVPPLQTPPIAYSTPQIVTNEETWEWVDYKGNERKITVHREVNYRG